MKRLFKLLLGIVVLLGIVYAAIHFYFEGGEDATELVQGEPPVQAQGTADADLIVSDLEGMLQANDGAMMWAQISRIIEDARDSAKAGKDDVAIQYIQNTKDFIAAHLDEVKALEGMDVELVEWLVNTQIEKVLNNSATPQ